MQDLGEVEATCGRPGVHVAHELVNDVNAGGRRGLQRKRERGGWQEGLRKGVEDIGLNGGGAGGGGGCLVERNGMGGVKRATNVVRGYFLRWCLRV